MIMLDGSSLTLDTRARARRILDALRGPGARALREALRFVREAVSIEANAATDNPMVFADTGNIVSGGNFHGAQAPPSFSAA